MGKQTNDDEYDSMTNRKKHKKKSRKDRNRSKEILSKIYNGDFYDVDEFEELEKRIG